MVRYRNCAVRGCDNKDAPRHSFPNPVKNMGLYNTWAIACKNSNITSSDPGLVYRSYRVCHIHFKAEDVASYNRLKQTAIPTLFLPAVKPQSHVDLPVSSQISTLISTDPEPQEVHVTTPTGSSEESLLKKGNITPTGHTVEQPSTSTSSALLSVAGVTRVRELGRKARKLYTHAKRLKATSSMYRRKSTHYKKKYQTLKNMTNDELVDKLTAPLRNTVREFIKRQIKLGDSKPAGRRYSLNDGILGLILHKQSPRGYRLFSKIFATPSVSTINRLLQKVPINPGLNDLIFQNLKKSVDHLPQKERLCSLLFDEMSIQPHLQLERGTNEVCGFENLGHRTSNAIADHAQVFIIKGIVGKYKQPLCYTFTRSTIKSMDLVRLLKLLISKCEDCGLKVVATVSDQGSTNVAAINYLKRITAENNRRQGIEADNRFYKVNGKNVIHIYDPPHLLKGIRNNLLTKNLVWEEGNEKHIARWSDIEVAFNIDSSPGQLRSMPKLTTFHVEKNKIKKMKVSYAAQVLSHSVAAVISLFARSGIVGDEGQHLQVEAKSTSIMCKFFDDLFDSVNGSTLYPQRGKELRCAVSSSSDHLKFWVEAKRKLRSMYFQKEGTNEKVVPPSLNNWITTITGFEELLKIVEASNSSFFKPRDVNQDAVENFFGQLRQHGHRNINPTPTNFKYSFTTLLIILIIISRVFTLYRQIVRRITVVTLSAT